jgi:sigma-B regulation protein RsbU (phosphoserine phosphatase)
MSRGHIRTEWRFVPSASLGGDAFGYHWLDSKRLALYLIDVSGHGGRPALLSVSVINALRSQFIPDTDFYSPANVLDTLNRAFPSEQNNAMFLQYGMGSMTRITMRCVLQAAGIASAIKTENR